MPHIRNSFIVLLIFLNSLVIYTQEIQEEIVVTGSFTKEIQASNPIFTSSIDDINKRGTFRVEDGDGGRDIQELTAAAAPNQDAA